jgi:AcrR family transcriptional regulator
VLSNETRLAILPALWETYDPHAERNAVPFSELRDRVGIRQGGQFNYHLEQLLGHFVRKGDDGYKLRQAARHVVQAVLSGTARRTSRGVDPHRSTVSLLRGPYRRAISSGSPRTVLHGVCRNLRA